jgi:hypothetical protein
MMDFDKIAKEIRVMYSANNKNCGNKDIIVVYRGLENGISFPWKISIESSEKSGSTLEDAFEKLYQSLKEELKSKVGWAEAETTRLKQTLEKLSINSIS